MRTNAVMSDHEREPSPVVSEVVAHSASIPWFTVLSLVVCAGVFLGLAPTDPRNLEESLHQFGYRNHSEIWNGAYWALCTPAYIHLELWHFAFNMYWLWALGARMERAIGTGRFAMFYLMAAFISAAYQLAFTDTTGIGASGAVYGVFGFMWLTREEYPSFRDILTPKNNQLMLVWLFACVLLTEMGVLHVANAAHFSGFLFGCVVAYGFVRHGFVRVARAAILVIACGGVPLFWSPWSQAWLMHQAYRAHVAKQYEVAVKFYTRVIDRDPDNAWAYLNRSYAYTVLKRFPEARADRIKAGKSDGPEASELFLPQESDKNLEF